MERNYQVIIIGAGPAGATLAYELAVRRINVLLIEKAKLPRYKCCGGGLTVKAAQLIGIDVSQFVDDAISSAIITLKGNQTYYGDSATPIMYTVTRENLDYVLFKRAQSAGVDTLQGVEALTIRVNDENVEVMTNIGKFCGTFVVGADGARSRLAKAIGINNHHYSILGLTCEVRVSQGDLAKWRTRIGIDIGRVRGGYGWVFPKSNHLSVGIACPVEKSKGLRYTFREYLDSLKLERHDIIRWAAGLLPIFAGQPTLGRDRVILLGDAAGLADPFTGEGIYNAILSAQVGAAAIEKALTDDQSVLDDYSDKIAATIIPEMKEALIFSKVLSRLPVKLFRVLNQDGRVWTACCRILRGEIGYSTIRKRINSIGGLYKLISRS